MSTLSDQPAPGGQARGHDHADATAPRARAAQDKAGILREALPWIREFHDQVVVVKFGGNVMIDDELARSFAADVALLHVVGLRPVVVHGGGPQISATAEALGIPSRFVGGLRVTDHAMLDAVRMALLGQVNPELVGLIEAAGAVAVGVAGTDARLLTTRRTLGPDGEELGLVGEIEEVAGEYLLDLLDDGFLPVVATVGRDRDGQDHNVNADTAAGAIAAAIGASKLVYLTDVPGLYRDLGEDPEGTRAEAHLLSEVGVAELEQMLERGELHAGMRPKIVSIVRALDDGVPRAHILDGRLRHSILLEIFTDEGVGTMIRPDGPEEEQA